ncbi:MAG: hypothetical protein KAW66_04895 [Candidatus Lokiarchaeota archaeon]|jgi:cytochrome bd-type quinol oxidase subunit 1|nr:hypothetical protein [Candidatus Lokiarchaeota archaeon]
MIFQLDLPTAITIVVVLYLTVSLISFIIGTYIMQIYASSKKWDDSFKIPLKINLMWLLISLAIGIPLSFLFGDNVLIDFVRFGVNSIIGVVLTIRYYKKDKGEAIQFTLVIQIVLFLLAVIFGYFFGMLTLYVIYS